MNLTDLEEAKGLIDEAAALLRDSGRHDLTKALLDIYWQVDSITKDLETEEE